MPWIDNYDSMALEGELDGEWGENTTLDQLLNDIFQDPTISAFLNKSLSVVAGSSEAAPQPPPYTASVGSPTPPSTTNNSWRYIDMNCVVCGPGSKRDLVAV